MNVWSRLSLSRPRSPLLFAAWGVGGVLGIVVLLGVIAVVLVWPQLPDLDEVEHYQPHLPLKIVTRDDVELGEFGPERREFVPIAKMPRMLQDAVIATEDTEFRTHNGVSVKGIVRAFFANLRHERSQGGSTITQQVARNFYLTKRKSYARKFSEVLLALKMERALSKDQILELYMNQIYLGQRAYGFEEAAHTYFGKTSAQLTVAEAAMLAGLPQNPYYANPVAHMDRALARQRVVLQRMRETGVIDERQYQAARDEKVALATRSTPAVTGDYIAEMVRQQVVQRYGEAAYQQGLKVTTTILSSDQKAAVAAVRRGILDFDRRQPWRGPEDTEELPDGDDDIEQAAAAALKEHPDDDELHVAIVLHASPKEVRAQLANGEQVTLAGDALRLVQAALKPRAPEELAVGRGAILRLVRVPARDAGKDSGKDPGKEGGWVVSQWPDTEAALISMDTQTGRIRALVGGFDFDRSKFNHVTSAWRQPGSSFKPFLYSAALEQGIMPITVINDAPLQFDETAGGGAHWQPKNDNGQFDGPLTLRQGLARSKNLVSIRLLQTIGIETVRDWAARFGLDRDKQPPYLTLALGAGSVTPAQMVAAYAVFANGGYRVAPRFIEKIVDAQGQVLFQAPDAGPPGEERRVIPERNAFVMDQLLNEVTRSGTAAKAQAALKRTDVYGKTGTTNDAIDAWFAGFQPSIATVVWMGRDDPSSLGAHESGGGLALPIWLEYMRHALQGVPVATLRTPPGVSRLDDDWVYDEYLDGGYVQSIGLDARPLDEEPPEGDMPPPVVTEPRGAPAAGGGPASPASPASSPGPSPAVPALPLSTVPPPLGTGRDGLRGAGLAPAPVPPPSPAASTVLVPMPIPVH